MCERKEEPVVQESLAKVTMGKRLVAWLVSALLCVSLAPAAGLVAVSPAWADDASTGGSGTDGSVLPNLPSIPGLGNSSGLPALPGAGLLPDLPSFPGVSDSSDLPSLPTAGTLPDLPQIPGLGDVNINDIPGLSDLVSDLLPSGSTGTGTAGTTGDTGAGTGAVDSSGSSLPESARQELEAILANEVFALFYRNGNTDTYTLVLQKGQTADRALGEPVETRTGFVCNEKIPTSRCVCRAWASTLNAKVTKVMVRDDIAPHSTSYWFSNMAACTQMDLAKLDMGQVKDMSGMFSGCTAMRAFDLSTFNLAKVQKMDYLFPSRSKVLTTIKVPSSANFAGVFPKPDPMYLPGATGKWVNERGKAYTSAALPRYVADTYTAQRGYSIANGYIKQTKFDFAYTGKTIRPSFAVRVAGFTLQKGVDYTVSYKKNKAVGKATMVVKGKGVYSGKLKCTFRINPLNVKKVAVKRAKKAVKVTWKKRAGQSKLITGYEVRVSRDKAAHKVKALKVVPKAKKGVTIKYLKAKTRYYVTMRTYKKIGKNYYYSSWSKPKTVRTK